MVTYFCGKPGCGKSLIAEQLLAAEGDCVLYVGTLPNTMPYWDIIRIHRSRRPSAWDLYECCGDIMSDLGYLSKTLDQYNGILLDGVAFYLNRAIQWGCQPTFSALTLLRNVLSSAVRLPVQLMIVDQPLGGAPPTTQAVGRLFHQMVYRYSKRLYLVENGQAIACSPKTLWRLDHGIYT